MASEDMRSTVSSSSTRSDSKYLHFFYFSRLEMASEDMRSTASSSSTRSDSGVGGSRDYNPHDAVKASFYAVRNTILEEIRTANMTTVNDLTSNYAKCIPYDRFEYRFDERNVSG